MPNVYLITPPHSPPRKKLLLITFLLTLTTLTY